MLSIWKFFNQTNLLLNEELGMSVTRVLSNQFHYDNKCLTDRRIVTNVGDIGLIFVPKLIPGANILTGEGF